MTMFISREPENNQKNIWEEIEIKQKKIRNSSREIHGCLNIYIYGLYDRPTIKKERNHQPKETCHYLEKQQRISCFSHTVCKNRIFPYGPRSCYLRQTAQISWRRYSFLMNIQYIIINSFRRSVRHSLKDNNTKRHIFR